MQMEGILWVAGGASGPIRYISATALILGKYKLIRSPERN